MNIPTWILHIEEKMTVEYIDSHFYQEPKWEVDIDKLISALKIAMETLEEYKHKIPVHIIITHHSAAYEQEFGLGAPARIALQKIEKL